MKNNLVSNETEWRGTGMLNISIDLEEKTGVFFLSNQETEVNRQHKYNPAICRMHLF